MFDDYKKKVILAYQKKREASDISINLVSPSPKKLKTECLTVYKERLLQKDEKTLRSFFVPKDNIIDYSQSISKFEIDKFRPLINFINGKTSDPDKRIVELLAWLIDFEPRPFIFGKNYDDEDLLPPITDPKIKEQANHGDQFESEKVVEPAIINEPGQYENIKNEEARELSLTTSDDGDNVSGKIIKFVYKSQKILGLFTALVIGIIIYTLSGIDNQQCMYWNGKQYQSIACDQKVEGANIIAQDTLRLNRLKKITNISSITRNDIRKVYYSKADNKVEFYTTGGENPEDSRKRLLPMTDHMFRKYVLHEDLK